MPLAGFASSAPVRKSIFVTERPEGGAGRYDSCDLAVNVVLEPYLAVHWTSYGVACGVRSLSENESVVEVELDGEDGDGEERGTGMSSSGELVDSE